MKETKEDAQESLRAALQVSGGKRRPVLVDLRKMQAQERDAREIYRGPETAQFASAAALLVESRISKLIANFFMAIVRAQIVIKIFTDEAEAVEWLQDFHE
ncbi:MAG TPA: STAS/SEC14 domain-containing protein [Herpetosiphonaceae bacterium]